MDEEQIQKTPVGSEGPEADPRSRRTKRSLFKRRPVIVIGVVVLGWLFYMGLGYLIASFTHESTDDAFLRANVVSLAPRVAGQVTKVYVNDNQFVKAGDPLVEIDPQDYQTQVAQKKAAHAAAEANVQLLLASIQLLRTQVQTAQATAKQSAAQARADQAKADEAEANLKRAESLIANKTISPQEYDAAKTAAAAADATLKAAQEKAASDRAKISEAQAQLQAGHRAWQRAQAQAKQAAVDVQQANLNLSYTHVTAPTDGRVTRKAVEDGDYVQVGQKLMAIVPTNVWVVANFKETQIGQMHPGQPVDVSIDSVKGRTFSGHVQSIQAGSGAAFSLLPPENAVGNYVKVVQRVPVKILFDHPLDVEHVLGPGMSVVPSVRVSSFSVPNFVVAIGAGVLALAVGSLWLRAAEKNPRT